MKFLVSFWMFFIFLATCTSDADAFIHDLSVSFTFQSEPAWQNIAFFYPLEDINMFETSGHFFMFFILALLLGVTTKLRIAIGIAAIYAVLTEFLQLFFDRGAELYDIMADFSGIIVAAFLVGLWKKARKRWEAPSSL